MARKRVRRSTRTVGRKNPVRRTPVRRSTRTVGRKNPVRRTPVRRSAPRRRSSKIQSKVVGYRPNRWLVVLGLIINVILFPGLGTLIGGGRIKHAIWQIILFIIGFILTPFSFVGAPIIVVAWVWALISSIHLLQRRYS